MKVWQAAKQMSPDQWHVFKSVSEYRAFLYGTGFAHLDLPQWQNLSFQSATKTPQSSFFLTTT